MHLIGIAPSSLIVGVLPVTVTLLGRRDHGAVPLARLAWPLAMVVAGIACINVDVFTVADGAPGTSAGILIKLAGLACAVGALACWTWFAVENARYLQRQTHFSGNEWSVLWGVVTGALGAALWLVIALLPSGSLQTTLAQRTLAYLLDAQSRAGNRRVVARQRPVECRLEAPAVDALRSDDRV